MLLNLPAVKLVRIHEYENYIDFESCKQNNITCQLYGTERQHTLQAGIQIHSGKRPNHKKTKIRPT